MHHAFFYVSLPSLLDYNVKFPHGTFYGGLNHITTNFSFSSKLKCGPQ